MFGTISITTTAETAKNAGASTFSLPLDTNLALTLYPENAKRTNYDPFGNPMAQADGEPNPRYTDHEYDPESGLNYMKGRYQLANFSKFNRPDPMRDWDWENPASINLYQYVRNNPVMANDPSGLVIDEGNLVNEPLWLAYKAAVLATEHGQNQWNILNSSSATFTIKFKKLRDDMRQLGKVDNYKIDEYGNLTSADINIDPYFLIWRKNYKTKGAKPGHEKAVDSDNVTINKIVGVGHEFRHGTYALEPGIAEKLVARDKLGKEIDEAEKNLPRAEYQRVYREKFEKKSEVYRKANVKNESIAVDSGNSIMYQINLMKFKAKRKLLRAIRKARKDAKKIPKEVRIP